MVGYNGRLLIDMHKKLTGKTLLYMNVIRAFSVLAMWAKLIKITNLKIICQRTELYEI